MEEDNITPITARRDLARMLLAVIQNELGDVSRALTPADCVAVLKHRAREVKALYAGEADYASLLDTIDDAIVVLSKFAQLRENCTAALTALAELTVRLAATPDEPPAS